MGESKRRKLMLGDRYGKQFKIGCYIDQLVNSDAHAVYLGIRKENISSLLISVHPRVENAWKALEYNQKTLARCNFTYQDEIKNIQTTFVFKLLSLFNNYESDFSLDDEKFYTKSKQFTVKKIPAPKPDLNGFGDPCDRYGFCVNSKTAGLLCSENMILVFSSYVTAAYICDYLNENPDAVRILDGVVIKRLWTEANRLQCKFEKEF